MQKGVTLIELLIAVAIFILMASVAVPIYGNLQTNTLVDEKADSIIEILKIARQNSMSRSGGRACGVKFFSNSVVLFRGSTYVTRLASFDWVIPIEAPLEITTNLINNEINFSTGLGEPDQTGEIYLNHPSNYSKIITINEIGLVSGN